VSQIKQVREKLIDIQKDIIKKKNVVMDGRDIGTKVMPNAEIKLFVTADLKVRAKRRFDEVNENDHDLTYDKILDNLVERDFDDENRKLNPLIRASDSILFDNTSISEVEQYNYITDLIKTKKNILCK
jgi:cytidylate kinase